MRATARTMARSRSRSRSRHEARFHPPRACRAVRLHGGAELSPARREARGGGRVPGRVGGGSGRAGCPIAGGRSTPIPQLDTLVEEALEHNSDLRVAAANLERALGVLSEERAALIPTTEINASATRERNSNTGYQPKTIYSAGFSPSYEIDLFGRVRRSIEAARADAQSLAATRDATRVTVAAATTQAYFDVCLLGVRLDVAKSSLDLISASYQGFAAPGRAGRRHTL